ncbi:MAG: alginate lyase [Chitinophagaceae bacterium]|nr:MAG: alginate lyase [Chitinophagaceae bacterium]
MMKIFLPVLFVLMHCTLPAQQQHAKSLKSAIATVLKPLILQKAKWAMAQQPVTVTASSSPRSAGGKHDFYSEGDYWWPNPASADSPYIQRDGLTNPDNFTAHRLAMIRFSQVSGILASAFILTGKRSYADRLLLHCKAWFVDTATKMNPHLLYAQAIKGRATGRGIGIIDGIQLMEVVKALRSVEARTNTDKELFRLFRLWFSSYLSWVTTHQYGIDEMNAKNNHGTCWVLQVAVFAGFTGDKKLQDFCRQRFKQVLLPGQLAADGSFPLELKRTKPYGYSIFNLDAMSAIAHELSTPTENLWTYTIHDSVSMATAVKFLYPFIVRKESWPYPKDVMYWDDWPVAQPFLLFAAAGLHNRQYEKTWETLDHDPQVEEVIRNLPVRNPLVWF